MGREAETANPHFETVESFEAAKARLTFTPCRPRFTAGLALQSLRIHVRDHKMREVPVDDRSLEAFYGRFSFAQARKGAAEARRWALDVSYGRDVRTGNVAGHEARLYELGPEPPPDDVDGRAPALVTWHDGEMHFLVASHEMTVAELVPIAASVYSS